MQTIKFTNSVYPDEGRGGQEGGGGLIMSHFICIYTEYPLVFELLM